VRITDNKDKTFRVEFEAQVAGVYTASVTFASVATPGSPYKINVEAAIDVSKVQVRGLPQSKYTQIRRYHNTCLRLTCVYATTELTHIMTVDITQKKTEKSHKSQ